MIIGKFSDNTDYNSAANQLRRQRLQFFHELVNRLKASGHKTIKILDVGGTENFRRNMGGVPEGCHVTLLNLTAPATTLPNLVSEAGNACYMPNCADKQFQ